MAALHSIFSLSFAFIAFCTFTPIEANNGGFSIDLIHRDSPKSPFFNPSETRSQRMRNALQRSINRLHRFNPSNSVSPNTALSNVTSDKGEYLMSISIGTPPFEILAIADTGSDLIWTQCKPCTQCYNQTAPLFDPENSSTYREISCSSSACQSAGGTSCFSTNETCQYSISYGDQSFTHGVVAVDAVTLGSTSGRAVSLPKTIFGCGHDNDGTFSENGSGIVGLGGGSASLISQMDSSINGKFSYCLVPLTSQSIRSSQMNFGSKGIVSGSGVVSTPLVPKSPDTYYFLTLEGISVGNEKLDFDSPSFDNSSEGNIIIDSGTTLTMLPEEFYNRLESSVSEKIDGKRVDDPDHILSLCYQTESEIEAPILTVHFTGADVELKTMNTFVRISEDIVCFAFAANPSLAIYGNVAQMDFLVGYDVEQKTLSFKATDCTQQ